MRNVPGITMFELAEIDDLQSCFDTILERRRVARSSDEAEAIARALILAYKRGVVDRQELIRLADIAVDERPQINNS
ncbi:MAG: hypothetical protein KDK08_02125 [Rhizobiaceae bacterium]|jgi:hypothetical protein|nr:hypothetical protein [Rhizobiaceae bacterium]